LSNNYATHHAVAPVGSRRVFTPRRSHVAGWRLRSGRSVRIPDEVAMSLALVFLCTPEITKAGSLIAALARNRRAVAIWQV